jgi:cation:H+ antiporter
VSLGNVIGSNLFNVALVASCAPWISLGFGGVLPRWVGMLLVYLGWVYRAGRRAGAEEAELATAEVQTTLGIDPMAAERPARVWGNVALVVVGLGLLVVGSHWCVLSAIDIARGGGVSELMIGLTIVAAGTSLPELVTSVVAAWRRNPDIAIGNILGSNIFNILGVLGVSTAVAPQTVSPHVLLIDVPLMVVATAALLPIMRTGGVISRREGGVLLGGYGLYLGILILRGS